MLQLVFDALNWENYGIKIDGIYLSNLRFADDIVLFASSRSQLQTMANQINVQSKQVGLQINIDKMKTRSNVKLGETNVTIDATDIENVTSFKYLGQILSFDNTAEAQV